MDAIEPAVSRGDTAVVLSRLHRAWPHHALAELLRSSSSDVQATAATCLGMTGSVDDCAALAELLGHHDERVASAAEDAMWRLWMTAGSEEGNARLAKAIDEIRGGSLIAARDTLDHLIHLEDSFAEAHHQMATIYHMLGEYDSAEAAYVAALERNPYHYAAVAGLGHLRIERDDFSGALACYIEALRINPRLTELRELAPQLEAAIRKRDVA